MHNIGGYRLGEIIHDGQKTRVYRARREGTDEPVIIKTYRHEYPTERELARFELAYEIGRQADGPGVIRHVALEKSRNALAIVTEDYGAVSLDVLLKDAELDLPSALRIAVAIAGALAGVHARNIVHKDIKPANVVMNLKTGMVKLIDFGMSSRLSQEHAAVAAPRGLEGTLPYISPEQTGRTNCQVDYRTDFYSLGVTLYELLTRRLPFVATDPMELVHCHLARQPKPLHQVKSAVPEAVSQIVLKLMSKSPDQRYLSAYGLQRDLEHCLAEAGAVEPFDLGRHDVPIRFQIPQKLYGREPETEQLLGAFDRVAAGKGHELVLVSGYSGIGKSALVHELHKPIVERRGLFCAGKFDQFRRDLPYRALVDAFRDLLRQHLTETAEAVERTARELREALGTNGRVISDLVPELERICGPQPEVPALGPMEALTRFNRTFQSFVRVFARREHPLTVFLDDLQWADLPSLQLLEVLVGDLGAEALFMVWAYRDNEVGEGHPLKETLQRLTADKVTTTAITLAPLDPPTLGRLIADTLFCSDDDARELAALLHARTHGNPFFVNECLKTLHQDGHVRFDAQRGRWDWDLAGVQSARITNNVVELMAGKLRRLPEPTQQVVALAAVVGNTFDLQALSQASGNKKGETAHDLESALAEGLVVPLDTAYKYAPSESDGNARYRFLHDRVHQAAYGLLDAGAREEMHLRVGRMLLAATPAEQRDEHIIDIVNHLNIGLARITDSDLRQRLVTLNLAAGRRAKASMAFAPARTYLRTALSLLPPAAWQAQHALALEIHYEVAEAESLCKDYAAMEEVARVALSHTKELLAQVPLRILRIQASVAQNQYRAAVDAALDLLGELGEGLPRNPGDLHVLFGVLRTKFTVRGRKPADFVSLPEMKDPRALAAMQVCLTITPAAYIGAPTLFPLIIFKMVALSVHHGNAGASAYAYGVYGLILCSAVGDIETGYEFGKLSLTLLQHVRVPALRPKVTLVFNGFVRHWKEPLRDLPPALLDVYFDALEQGDAEYAGYAGIFSFYYSFWSGRELKPLLDRFGPHLRDMKSLNQEPSLPVNALWEQVVRILSDKTTIVHRQTGPLFDADRDVPLGLAANNMRAVFYGLVTDGMIAYLFGEYERAERDFEQADKYPLLGVYTVSPHAFYQALTACARARSGVDRRPRLKVVKKCLAKLEGWAKANPANQAHKVALVAAERERVLGHGEAAAALYQQAIDGARANGFINEEALACELFGCSLLDRGHKELGEHLVTRAAQLYTQWGAVAKAEELKARKKDASAAPLAITSTLRTDTQSVTLGGDAFDFTSLIKVTRSLSGEIGLDKLLRRTLDIVSENAGAQRGSLLLERKGELTLVAERTADEGEAALRDVPSKDIDTLPLTLLAYCRRTMENVVLADATRSDLFRRDAYIVAKRPKSVLAFPIVNRGTFIGLVYLENNLSEGAFTPERLEVLETLLGQAAVSIENARLYRNLESALDSQVRVAKAQARFVPNEFLHSLSRDTITDVELGDNVRKEMSVLFSDIRGFTNLFEGMSPEQHIGFLNTYLSHMEPAIIDAGGFVETYIGDAIMALFDGPAEKAVRAGIGMCRNLRLYNEKRVAEGLAPMEMGIGVNTGSLTLGTLGGPQRLKCSVIGDSVNLAARIESLTKEYHALFLISGHTRDRLVHPEAFDMRLVAKATVKGKTIPVTLYEILDAEPPELRERKMATMAVYNEGVAAYYDTRFDEASRSFQSCLARFPGDSAARRYLYYCEQYRSSPPPPGWTGVETLKHK